MSAHNAESGVPLCTCFWTDPSTWLSAASCGYGSGYEPGSQMEWNPDCLAHPPAQATDEALALALRILAPGDDDNLTLGELRNEYGIKPTTPTPPAEEICHETGESIDMRCEYALGRHVHHPLTRPLPPEVSDQ